MPDRSKVMTQTKSDTLVPRLGVGRGADNPPHKYYSVEELLKLVAKCLRTVLEETKIKQ